MLDNLPPISLEELNIACAAVGIIADERNRNASACYAQAPGALGDDEYENFIQAAEAMERVWEATTSRGIMRRDFWPTTGRRRRTFVNSALLKWSGISPEEFVTRIQARELGFHQSEFEMLVNLCDEMTCANQPVTTRVQRHRYKPGFCLFVRISTTRVFDFSGRLVRMEHVYEPLSIEALNEVLRTDPGSVQIKYMGSGSSYAEAGWRDQGTHCWWCRRIYGVVALRAVCCKRHACVGVAVVAVTCHACRCRNQGGC